MDIDRFKDQHVEILQRIDRLRDLAHSGITANARAIAQAVSNLGDLVKRHLAVEDRILYPAVQRARNPKIAAMGRAYQEEMAGIANAYIRFTARWSDPTQLMAAPEEFRADANSVLKEVYRRMQREDTEFYPSLEHI